MSEDFTTINYRRLPYRLEIFRQQIVHRGDDFVVTFLERASLEKPVRAGSRIILEDGAPIVWFTYRDRWYDVGRFHLADGTFTGCYANILTPVDIDRQPWETTDLFLDVWKGPDDEVAILDEAEFQLAVDRGWIDPPIAAVAREHAESLAAAARQGMWPHPEVKYWTLERARMIAEAQLLDPAADTIR